MRIMIDGDSFGYGDDGFGHTDGGIGPELSARLTTAGVTHDIVNVALGGTTYANRAAAIGANLTAQNPDLVICIAGHNDAANAGSGVNVTASVAQSVRLYTDAVLQRRADPNRIKLVIGTIPRTTDTSRPWLNDGINTVNFGVWKSWDQWAYARWVPVLFDMCAMPPQYLNTDHVHPLANGYKWMAHRVYEAMQVGGQIAGLPPLPLPGAC